MAFCLGHVDPDGYASSAIVMLSDPDCLFLPVNYGYKLPDKIRKGDKVYLVDFSFPQKEMDWLSENTDLTWIDHHELSFKDLTGLDGVKGIRSVEKSACELTWEYFRKEYEVPKAIKLIGAYDVGDFGRYNDVIEFNKGLKDFDIFPIGKGKLDLWKRIFTDGKFVDEIIVEGAKIYRREKQYYKNVCRYKAFEINLFGYNALCMNESIVDGFEFRSVANPDVHDLLIGFYYGCKTQSWKFSVRHCHKNKKDIDVGAFCKAHFPGGGGHVGAGGFSVTKLSDVPGFEYM